MFVVTHLVYVFGGFEILLSPRVSFNQVIAVNGSGDGGFGETRRHELQDCHLGSSVLHGNAVGSEFEVTLAGNNLLIGIIEMAVEDFLWIREQATVSIFVG